ncbi:MAG: hypothetical protein QOK43_3234 [Acidimicrobiaceae bacterium]|nr:hypothetical protein [Acidimicrobiaceae bacterium]
MVALPQPRMHRHLRLVTDDEVLGGIEGGMASGRGADLAFLRRRIAAVALAVALLIAVGLALGRAGNAAERAATVPMEQGEVAALPIAQGAYVVQPGDTLWKIARALQPTGDVRPLVAQLGRVRHGAPLRVGERIMLP